MLIFVKFNESIRLGVDFLRLCFVRCQTGLQTPDCPDHRGESSLYSCWLMAFGGANLSMGRYFFEDQMGSMSGFPCLNPFYFRSFSVLPDSTETL